MSSDYSTSRLLQDLAEAKAWPHRLKCALESGSGVSDEIAEAGRKIEALEKRAQEAMKELGCECAEARAIYAGMADMLINWHTFKDSLG